MKPTSVGEFLRLAQARREGNRGAERLLHCVGHAIHHRGPEDARCDGVDADAERASSRAIGKVMPTTPPLEAEYAA
jgi:hypothetical protein